MIEIETHRERRPTQERCIHILRVTVEIERTMTR